MDALLFVVWLTVGVIGTARLLKIPYLAPERLAGIRLALVCAGITILMTGLGILGLLGTKSSFILLSGLTLLGAMGWWRTWDSEHGTNRVRLTKAECILIVIPGLIGLVNFLSCLSPEIRHDAYDYHLNVPNLYIITGSIHELTWHVFSYMPKYGEMFYALLMPVTHDVATRLVHFGFGLMTLRLIYDVVRVVESRRAALLAIAFTTTTPLFSYLSTVTYVELIRAVWELAALYIIVKSFDGTSSNDTAERDWRTIVLLGLFCGMMLGTKYVAWLVSWVPIAFILLIFDRGRFIGRIVNLALVTGIALLVCSPWLIYNAYWTGNPVYPLLPSIFGMNVPAADEAYAFIRGHAPDADVYIWAALPGYVLMRFNALLIDGNGFFLLLALVMSVVTLAVPSLRKRLHLERNAVSPLLFYLWCSFLLFMVGTGNHDGRFAITTLLTAPSIVVLLWPIWAETMFTDEKYRTLRTYAGPILLALMLGSWGYHRIGQAETYQETFVTALSEEARWAILDRRFPLMPMVRIINDRLESDDLVYGVGYPCRIPYIPKLKYGYLKAFPNGVPEEYSPEWLKGMWSMGVTYTVLDNPQLETNPLVRQAMEQGRIRTIENVKGFVLLQLIPESQ